MNNALNSISMQAELARMYSEQDNNRLVGEALTIIMSQCRRCSEVSQNTQSLLEDEREGDSSQA